MKSSFYLKKKGIKMKHWLYVEDPFRLEQAIKMLNDYKKINPGSTITHFFTNTGSDKRIMSHFFCLETKQNYRELDLDVNSFSSPIYRQATKPKNLYESSRTFEELTNSYIKE